MYFFWQRDRTAPLTLSFLMTWQKSAPEVVTGGFTRSVHVRLISPPPPVSLSLPQPSSHGNVYTYQSKYEKEQKYVAERGVNRVRHSTPSLLLLLLLFLTPYFRPFTVFKNIIPFLKDTPPPRTSLQCSWSVAYERTGLPLISMRMVQPASGLLTRWSATRVVDFLDEREQLDVFTASSMKHE